MHKHDHDETYLALQEEILRRLKETEALVERFSNENERLASQIDLMRTQTRTAGDYKGDTLLPASLPYSADWIRS